MTIISVSIAKVYRYGIATFEYGFFIGPTPCRRCDLEPIRNWGDKYPSARWWADFYRWHALPEKEREEYRCDQ